MKNDRPSLFGVVAANVLALAIAAWQHWPLVTLLWPYWLQSLIIGWYSRKRILALEDFSLANTSGFDQGSPEATKCHTARFFSLHYGAYAVFLWFAMSGRMQRVPSYPVSALDLVFIAILAVSFVPNIGGVMFLPYLRIIPMHLTIILGLGWGYATGVMLFGTLKTLADALMHWIEYRITTRAVESPA